MEEVKEIKKLFDPIKIGTMVLKNRAVYAPMIVGLGGPDGEVTPELIEYYVETAKGDMGLLTIEATAINRTQKGQGRQLGISRNEHVAGLNALIRAIQTYIPNPPKIAIQLVAFGRETEPEVSHAEIVAPSAVPSVLHPIFTNTKSTIKYHNGIPRELTVDEIVELEDDFAEAAQRAQFAGFDAIEFHAAHGYLIAQFLSSFTNQRNDLYGQDRNLFLSNIIEKTKNRVGTNFPIIVRFSGSEFVPGGATIQERQELAKKLETLGISALSISGGIYETGFYIIQPMMIPHGCHLENAAKIKEVVNIPVYAAGRINDPRLAEKALLDEKVDLVAFGRPFLADREFLIKAKQGKFKEIRKCIACNNCIGGLFAQKRVECTVNPAVGDPYKGENIFKQACKTHTKTPKKVIVVGGGPGGMEFAKIAAERGHTVVLYEKNTELGGNLIPAAAVSFKEELKNLLAYQKNEIKRTRVKVELGTELTVSDILNLQPDTLILATGSIPILPDIPGINEYRDKVYTASDILQGKAQLGKNVTVVGGGMIGCETAVWLSERGHQVTLVTRRSSKFGLGQGLAPDMESLSRMWLFFVKWPALGIQVIDLAQYNEITAEGLLTVNQKWEHETILSDNIVFSLGFRPNDVLFKELNGKIPEMYMIGDCKEPRRILHAIREGAVCGQSI